MSTVSGVSGSNSSELLKMLQNVAKATSASSTSGTTGSGKGPEEFLTSELEKQGYTGSKLSDLQAKIEAAVQSVQSSSSESGDPSKIHDAINTVLKEAGVDTDKIDADMKAQRPSGPPPGGKGGASNRTSGASASDTTNDTISALLEQLGVNPTDFESALESALKNSDGTGSIDLSKLFASAGSGSQVDVYA